MKINNSDENKMLINAAKEAMERSYSPYSQFKVGAAVLTEDGKVYKGCNIENSSYGATICAERTAIFKAVSEGAVNIIKIAIVSSSGEHTFPCGICRQVLVEFAGEDALVLLEGEGGEAVEEYTLSELVPYAFDGTLL